MKIFFGLELDQLIYPEQPVGGYWYCGPKKLLTFLETHLGLVGHPTNNDFLRIEQFRQAIQRHQVIHPEAYYAASFGADPLATAATLLERRDELKLGGWDFIPTKNTPNRLKTISQIENIAQTSEEGLGLSSGFADRWCAVLETLPTRFTPIDTLYLNESLELFQSHFKKAFDILKNKNVKIIPISDSVPMGNNDLNIFKKSFTEKITATTAQIDGSILVLKAKRVNTLANFVAKIFQKNNDYQPLCLVPEKNRTIDNAIIQEGLPSLGILSESSARPALQLLKLATAFLWQPIDPFKILEFMALKVKPLADFDVTIVMEKDDNGTPKTRIDNLSAIVSRSMSAHPGLGNRQLKSDIARYFSLLEEQASFDEFKTIQKDYKFWFSRKRYDISQTVPKGDVIRVFEFIAQWAKNTYDKTESGSLLVLSEQAKRIVELIEALPPEEQQLTNLEVERIVRTIYEPSPVSFKKREVGHLEYIHHTSAVIAPVQELLWWNFSDMEPAYFFSKWYQSELKYLQEKTIVLDTPAIENARLLWQRKRPFIYTQKRIILCLPHLIDGKEAHPHPLLGNLEACFKNIDAITVDIDKKKNLHLLEKINLEVPLNIKLDSQILESPKPYLNIEQVEYLKKRNKESYSSLDALLYYPYKWVFRYKLDLQQSSILSIVKDNTLMGNLAHRVFEELFKNHKDEILSWNANQIMEWVQETANDLMVREGAVLLMYGREPDRIAFVSKLKFAACTLIDMIRKNGWRIKATEQRLSNHFLDIEIKGIVDLVLENDRGELAVIDLKWRGANRREQQIRNKEDLQLVMYSHLLTKKDDWAHTAFFIMEQGKMIARNNVAFKEAIAADPTGEHIDINQEILDKMKATYKWRIQQLKAGQIEIRTEQTLIDIEEGMTSEELMNILEMKSKNAPFDDFTTLIGLNN
ncbi:MAG: RecB family exonuclease [Saprospiraceae bacterium]